MSSYCFPNTFPFLNDPLPSYDSPLEALLTDRWTRWAPACIGDRKLHKSWRLSSSLGKKLVEPAGILQNGWKRLTKTAYEYSSNTSPLFHCFVVLTMKTEENWLLLASSSWTFSNSWFRELGSNLSVWARLSNQARAICCSLLAKLGLVLEGVVPGFATSALPVSSSYASSVSPLCISKWCWKMIRQPLNRNDKNLWRNSVNLPCK